MARGVFVQGVFVRGFMSGGFCPGGFCPRTIKFGQNFYHTKLKLLITMTFLTQTTLALFFLFPQIWLKFKPLSDLRFANYKSKC